MAFDIMAKESFYMIHRYNFVDFNEDGYEDVIKFVEKTKDVKRIFPSCILFDDVNIPRHKWSQFIDLINICRSHKISTIITSCSPSYLPICGLMNIANTVVLITRNEPMKLRLHADRLFVNELISPFNLSTPDFDEICTSCLMVIFDRDHTKISYCDIFPSHRKVPQWDLDISTVKEEERKRLVAKAITHIRKEKELNKEEEQRIRELPYNDPFILSFR